MTAPVVQQATGRPASYLVQFVMPSHFTAQTLPAPEDARVRTREIPQQLAAAVRFSGRWTRKEFEERGTALRRAVIAAGLPGRSGALCPLQPALEPGSSGGTRSCYPSRSNREVAAEVLHHGHEDTASADVPLQAANQPGPASGAQRIMRR